MLPKLHKPLLLLKVLLKNPLEFFDRIRAIYEQKRRPQPTRQTTVTPWNALVDQLSEQYDTDVHEILSETELADLEVELTYKMKSPLAGFNKMHDADWAFARLVYLATRLVRPTTVIETGVAHGVNTTMILTALEMNGAGELWSIDLPPLSSSGNDHVGQYVPGDIRHRWNLHRGASKRVLPGLMQNVSQVDLFVHDSLFTYHNTMNELSQINHALSRESMTIVNCVEQSDAFVDWCDESDPGLSCIVQAFNKPDLIGVTAFHNAPHTIEMKQPV